ncbi:MAG: hypothetical protein GEU82_19255 [Luteitalea sp.]|nr:hypothetical protein [Luteitalea sp.]
MAPRVNICHRTNGDTPFILITVDDHALAGHVDHGDGYPGQPVPGQSGNVFGTDCQVVTALACPCWANLTEAQLVTILSTEFGVRQADCTGANNDVFARGIDGNSTEIAAMQTDMSCTLRTSTNNVSMTSLPASVFDVCLTQARKVIQQLSVCFD